MSALGLWGLVSGCAGEIKDLSRILLPRKSHWEAHGKQRERKTRLRRFRAEEGKTYFVVKDKRRAAAIKPASDVGTEMRCGRNFAVTFISNDDLGEGGWATSRRP
jgi:hypothetical protein